MAFHSVRFPVDISNGSSGGPTFLTNVAELKSGAEQRTARWGSERRAYDAAYGVKSEDSLRDLEAFFLARKGRLHSFLYWDPRDYTTAADATVTDAGTITPTDVRIGTGNATGGLKTFQLVKVYTDSGGVEHTRNITKPIEATVRVAVDGSEGDATALGWTVDDATGIVTFTSAPANGAIVTAGFQFDVHARFGADKFDVRVVGHDNFEVSGSVPIVEVTEDTILDEDMLPGRGSTITMSADTALSPTHGKVVRVDATAPGLALSLPETTAYGEGGGPYWILINVGANDFDCTYAGSTVFTVVVGDQAAVLLGTDGAGNLTWIGGL